MRNRQTREREAREGEVRKKNVETVEKRIKKKGWVE